MTVFEWGDPAAPTVLIQPVGEHDPEGIQNELAAIRNMVPGTVRLLAVRVDDWNRDLSPWPAPAVFGKEGFGGRAAAVLEEITEYCKDTGRTYYIGGYSLAGLFALWAAYQTDCFRGVAAASPSIWFPGFTDYMKKHEIRTKRVYLSLGDREERSRNPLMASVGARIREACNLLQSKDIPSLLEWNPGNHFRDADIRTAKAFAWVVSQEVL